MLSCKGTEDCPHAHALCMQVHMHNQSTCLFMYFSAWSLRNCAAATQNFHRHCSCRGSSAVSMRAGHHCTVKILLLIVVRNLCLLTSIVPEA
jgi:hypothetical protein